MLQMFTTRENFVYPTTIRIMKLSQTLLKNLEQTRGREGEGEGEGRSVKHRNFSCAFRLISLPLG